MTAKFTWMGLNSDREKQIYLDAFWEGVNATQTILDDVKVINDEYLREQLKDLQTRVQQDFKADGQRDQMDGCPGQD